MPKRGGTEFRRCDRAWRVAQAICGTTRAASTRAAGARAARARAARGRVLSVAVLLTSIAIAPPAPAVASPPDTVIVFAAASLADALQEAADLFTDRTGHERDAVLRGVRRARPADHAGRARRSLPLRRSRPGPMRWRMRASWNRGAAATCSATASSSSAMGPDGPPRSRPRVSTSMRSSAMAGSPSGWSRPSPPAATARPRSNQAGLWEVAQNPLAQTDNVRAALALVASGAAPGGHRLRHRCARRAPRPCDRRVSRPTATRPSFTRLPISRGADGPAENALFAFLEGDRRRRDLRSPRVRRSCRRGTAMTGWLGPEEWQAVALSCGALLGHGAQPAVRHPRGLCPGALAVPGQGAPERAGAPAAGPAAGGHGLPAADRLRPAGRDRAASWPRSARRWPSAGPARRWRRRSWPSR
jgi:molybdate transport system substrate-binding protein